MTTPCPSCGQPHGLVDALPQLLRSASEMVPGAPGLVHTLAEALGEAIRSWVLSPDTMPTPERSKPPSLPSEIWAEIVTARYKAALSRLVSPSASPLADTLPPSDSA